MTAQDEIILTLLHFRHYVKDILLGSIFGISKQTANNIHHRGRDWFFQLLKPELSFHSFEWRKLHGGNYFWDHNSMLTFLIDGSEQEICAPKDAQFNTLVYSAKKGQCSLNILLWTSIDGKILKISDSFPGIRNDTHLLESTNQDWISELEECEFGFGDAIFNNHQIYKVFTVKDRGTQAHRNFSHFRIRIEQTIERVKNFQVCSMKIRIKVEQDLEKAKDFHQKCWTIASVLANRYTI